VLSLQGELMDKFASRYLPVNDSDPSCSLTYATLCIYFIDPDIVTQKLGISPTLRQKKGSPSTLPNGKTKIGVTNSWLLISEYSVSSKDVRTHLNWLLDKIVPVEDQVRGLQQIPDVKMFIKCLWFSADGGGGPVIWPEQMEKIARLNLELNFSFAYYGDEY
jgi:hypothetical protein